MVDIINKDKLWEYLIFRTAETLEENDKMVLYYLILQYLL